MKLGRWLGLLALVGLFYLLWRIRQVVLLIFAAIVLALPFNRLTRRLQRVGVGRRVAMLISIATFLTLVFLIVGILVPPLISQIRQVALLLPSELAQILIWLNQQQTQFFPTDRLPLADLAVQIQPIARWLIQSFLNWFSDLVTVVLYLLLLVVLTIMLFTNPAGYRNALMQFTPFFYRARIHEVLTRCEETLVKWMQYTTIDMLLVAGLSTIGLALLHLPFVLTHATLAGLLEAVPIVGPLLSLTSPLIAALIDAPWKILVVLGLYTLIHLLKGVLLRYWRSPQPSAILPALLLLAQLAFAFAGGIWGLLLAVPIVLAGKILIQEIVLRDIYRSSDHRATDHRTTDHRTADHRSSDHRTADHRTP